MFLQLRSGRTRTVLLGFAGCLLIFGGSQLVGEASPLLATAPTLGAASSFAVLGGSTVTNTGASTIRADLGVSPGSAVTGFPPGLIVNGSIHTADALAGQAQDAATTAYNALAAQPCTSPDLTGHDLGLMPPLAPGVYCFSSTAQLTGTLTLNATGDGVYVFKIGSALTTASNSKVVLIGGSPCNVFWQVTSSATLGTGTNFVGTIIALTSISLTTGATVSGRALARNGAVTLDTNDIGTAGCALGSSAASVIPATATPGPPAPGPFVPRNPAPTANLPLTAPTSVVVAAATSTSTAVATATTTATQPTAIPTIQVAGVQVIAPNLAGVPAQNAPAPNAGVAPNAETAPAAETPALAETAPAPAPQLPTTLPRTGGGLPPLGLWSLLLGGLAVVGAFTFGRARK